MTSLKHRLSFGLTAIIAVLLFIQWALISYFVGQMNEDQLLDRMQREAESLLASIEIDADGEMKLDPRRMSSVYMTPFSGHYYTVCANLQCQQSRSLWDHNFSLNLLRPGERINHYTTGPEEQRLLTLTMGFRKQGQQLTIAIAEDTSALQAQLSQFQLQFSLLSAAGLLLLLLIQWWLVRNALQPLGSVKADLTRLERGEIDQISTDAPDEIQPMINELNQLLHSLTRKNRRSREALGNLAHALKTRLTLINQIADRAEIRANRELQDTIYNASTAIGQIIERELKRARLLGAPLPGQRVALRQELTELTETLRQLYLEKSIQFHIEIAGEAKFYGDREDLLEMLGNLLDNACKWCEQEVKITIIADKGVQFIIEDDGSGCSAEHLHSITRRGFRADETRPGSGLGLAIVYDIVDSYDGELLFDASSMGGLKVIVELPERYSR
ncbi:MAG: sensor histidine kinase [Methylophaga sp.]|nr:sensor histidine kinase [Methylophaga sp.]